MLNKTGFVMNRCCKQYMNGFHQIRCQNKGRDFVNGRWWCGTHSPLKKKTQAQKDSYFKFHEDMLKKKLQIDSVKFVEKLALTNDEALNILADFERDITELKEKTESGDF